MQPQGAIAWDTADEPTIEAPEPIERPVMLQRWDDLTFLHWPYAPETVAQLLPPGLQVDTIDGAAWVGVVPFRLTIRAPGMPAVPWAGRFAEVNVRTYVRGPDGRRGIWFLSLDAARLGGVLLARQHLPHPVRVGPHHGRAPGIAGSLSEPSSLAGTSWRIAGAAGAARRDAGRS